MTPRGDLLRGDLDTLRGRGDRETRLGDKDTLLGDLGERETLRGDLDLPRLTGLYLDDLQHVQQASACHPCEP